MMPRGSLSNVVLPKPSLVPSKVMTFMCGMLLLVRDTVNNEGRSYLNVLRPSDYQFRTIQDVTVVTNRSGHQSWNQTVVTMS